MNIFMPLAGNDDNVSWPGLGLVAFKLFLALLMLNGASVSTITTIMLIGGLAAVVLSILAKVVAGDKTLAADGYHVERDRGQTRVRFDSEPTDAVQDALSSTFGARWDRRHRAWRIPRRVRVADVAQVIESARTPAPAVEAHRPLAAQPSPRRAESGAPLPVATVGNATYAGYGWFDDETEVPRPTPTPSPAPTGGNEAQEALAYLEHNERRKEDLWSGAS